MSGAAENEQGQSASFSPIEDDMDVSTQESYEFFERYGNKSIPEGAGNFGDCFKDDTIKYDEDTFDRQEQDSRQQRLDMLSSGRIYDNIKEENSDEMIGCAGNLGKHIWDDIQQQYVVSPEFNQGYDSSVKKPKTFRDVFKLDDPTSDDTSSSLDSGKEVETEHSLIGGNSESSSVWRSEVNISGNTEGQSTPDMSVISAGFDTPEQRTVQSELNTPQILDLVLDLNENRDTLETQKPDIVLGSLVYTEHALEAKDEISQVEMDEGASVDEMDTDNEKTGEVQHDKRSDDLDMEDCDKVLKVLLELKAIAQFVLKRKTDIQPDHLDEVLQKCLSLKYVSGSSKLWKITDEGVAYISKKTGESDHKREDEKKIQVERKVKQVFKGPPPSPMALLNKDGASLNSNKEIDNNSRQNVKPLSETFTSHSPNSLFKPPTVRNSNSSNSGLPSLMSIQFDSNQLSRTEQRNRSCESLGQESPQPLMSVQLGSKSLNRSEMLPSHNQKGSVFSSLATSDKQKLDSNLWGLRSSGNSSNILDSNLKPHNLGQSVSINEHLPKLSQFSSTSQISQNTSSQQVRLSQNTKRMCTDIQKETKRDIPNKYADYPNQSTSLQCLKSKPQSKHLERSGSSNQTKSAFNKGPPPSPLDIISKGLKKTEISPPSSYKDSSVGLSASQNHIIGKNPEFPVNQSFGKQSGSLFGNENKQTVFQKSDQRTVPSSPQSLASISTYKGPPPPPAVKLGLQVAQSSPVSNPAQNKPKPNLGLVLNTESYNALNKNPVSALMEYAQSRKMVATVEVLNRKGSSHKPT